MLRYEIIANVGISIDLHNNYTVVALAKWNKEKESYLATFYIKQTDIDHLDLMDDQIEIEFSSEIKTIKNDLVKYIEMLIEREIVQRYVDRYKYELDCIDRGTAMFELERNVK